MEDYKVYYKQKGIEKTTDWLSKKSAEQKFKRLQNEKELITEWAELSVWSDEEDNLIVIKSFDRRKVEIFGHTLLLK